MRLVLHIGSTKTGSSALQATLFAERRSLARHGVLYSEAGVAAGAHHLLAAAIHPGAWRMHEDALPADRAAYFAATAAAMRAEAEAVGAHTLIVSSEYFWGSLPLETYRAVDAAFRGLDRHMVAFVRRQDEWASSSYLQAVKHGERDDFADWLERALRRPQVGLHYFRVINRWAHLLGASVSVIDYARAKANVFAAFADAIGVAIDAAAVVPPQVNPSPSAEGVAQLLAVSRSDRPEAEKVAERKRIMEAHRASGRQPPLAQLREHRALAALSARSDRLIEATFGPRPLFQPETDQPAPNAG